MAGILAFVLASAPAMPAQNAPERVDLGAVEKIRRKAFERSQVTETASYLADVTGPRLTGSPNLRAAAEWCAAEMRRWGLARVRLEPWGPFGRGWSLEGFTANMVAPSFSPLVAYPKAWSPSTDGVVRGDAVYVDPKTPADLDRYRGKLRGAIVLLGPPAAVPARVAAGDGRLSDEELAKLENAGPPEPSGEREMAPERRAQFELALARWRLVYSERPAVVLSPGRGEGGTLYVTDATVTGPAGTPPDAWPRPWAPNAGPVLPQAVVAGEHYNRIVRLIERGVKVRLEVAIASRFYDDDPMSSNVIGEIPGSDLSDEVVMLGGCLDSWHAGTGATDNAAGAAVCLEAVRILKAVGLKPRRTVRVALWSGEEQGRLGSRAWVAEHLGSSTEHKAEYEKLSCYFNVDYGAGRFRGIFAQGNEAVRPIFRAWLAPFADLGASTVSLANSVGADHTSFDEVGIPAFMFIRDGDPFDGRSAHTNMDVFERIEPDALEQAAAILAAFVYDAATRDGRLPRRAGVR